MVNMIAPNAASVDTSLDTNKFQAKPTRFASTNECGPVGSHCVICTG